MPASARGRKFMTTSFLLIRGLFLALLLAGGARAGEVKASGGVQRGREAVAGPRSDIKGLPNFAKVSESLYRGAQPDREGFEELRKLGAKSVVNLRAGYSDEKLLKGLGFRYFSVPTRTWHLTYAHSARFLKIVSDPANQPVFVHCRHGADRTGTMVAVYRIYVQKWKTDDAIRELPLFGFHNIWQNLRWYLSKLEVKRLETEIQKLGAQEPDEPR